MIYSLNIPVLLAILFFVLPIGFKLWYRQRVLLSNLAKCALAAMVLPDLAICLFYLMTNPIKAFEMTEAVKYLTIAILIIAYLAVQEIRQTFMKKKDTS